jgi:hypothetical protein
MKTNYINADEKYRFAPKKALTEEAIGSIVNEVPRGLRNSKPAET